MRKVESRPAMVIAASAAAKPFELPLAARLTLIDVVDSCDVHTVVVEPHGVDFAVVVEGRIVAVIATSGRAGRLADALRAAVVV